MTNINKNLYNSKFKELFLMVPNNSLEGLTEDNQNTLFRYGLIEFATKLKVKYDSAVLDVIYAWYHDMESLPLVLLKHLEEIQAEYEDDYILSDEDYQGFVSDPNAEKNFIFNPQEDFTKLRKILAERGLTKWVCAYSAIRKAAGLLNVGDFDTDALLEEHSKITPGDVFAKVHPRVMQMRIKNEISLEAFKMYCAIRSIEGKKSNVTTTKKHISARMKGQKASKGAEPLSRRLIDKYIKELVDLGLVSMIAGGRCWHLSTKLPAEVLKRKVEARRNKKRHASIFSQTPNTKKENVHL